MEPNSMSSMNVSLPEQMRRWVETVVSADSFGTSSEYVRSLIREDQKRRAREELDAKLLHALDSGTESELTADDFANIRNTVRKKIQRKKQA